MIKKQDIIEIGFVYCAELKMIKIVKYILPGYKINLIYLWVVIIIGTILLGSVIAVEGFGVLGKTVKATAKVKSVYVNNTIFPCTYQSWLGNSFNNSLCFKEGAIILEPGNEYILKGKRLKNKLLLNITNYGIWAMLFIALLINHFKYNREYKY